MLTAMYLLALALTTPLVVSVFAIVSMSGSGDRGPFGQVEGYRSIWLWILGFVTAACMVLFARNARPTEFASFGVWFQAYPVAASASVAAVLVAFLVGFWHATWIRATVEADSAKQV